MKLVIKKSCLAFCTFFWWRNVHVNFFTTLKYRASFSAKYEHSGPYLSKSYMEPSPPCVRGCMLQMIMVWHNNVASWRYAAGCVLTYDFWGWDMASDGPHQDAYWTQQNILTHAARLLKLQNIQNSPQTNCLNDQFCWMWLLKRTTWPILPHFW